MTANRHFDTVAFDIKDNASMLFFARTATNGDIADYLLVMRAEGEEYDDSVYLEMNEQQLAGHDLVREARLAGNILTLELHEPASSLEGEQEIVLTFDETEENKSSIESGVFRVLGALLAGARA